MKRVLATEEVTLQQMQDELDEHFAKINSEIAAFMRKRPFAKLETDYCYIEHRSLENMIYEYIKYYNENVKEYGNGFETDWDGDASLQILYRDGSIAYISDSWVDGTKRIKTDGIVGMIVDSGWGSCYAGKNIKIYNMREAVDYGKWGYKDLEQRYNDFDDIRIEFDV